ncbi:MAG: 8-oxo-dGTP diphosphatase [Myxococcota bacterium]|jgi:8-oxo-dGTP diphosphatase
MADDSEFLESYDPSVFDRPSLATDVVVLTASGGALRVVLVRRTGRPELGQWALPGTFVGLDEGLDAAARRALEAKAGLRDVFVEQLYTFGRPDRDPRHRVVSVAHYALVPPGRLALAPGAALAEVRVPWEGEAGGPVELWVDGEPVGLAFDHADIVATAVLRIRGKLDYTPIGFELLGPAFTLRQLRLLHQTILGQALNKDSFRRRVLATGLVEATGERQTDVGHRPAALYRYRQRGG